MGNQLNPQPKYAMLLSNFRAGLADSSHISPHPRAGHWLWLMVLEGAYFFFEGSPIFADEPQRMLLLWSVPEPHRMPASVVEPLPHRMP